MVEVVATVKFLVEEESANDLQSALMEADWVNEKEIGMFMEASDIVEINVVDAKIA